jgi:hypothetical protein
MSIRFLTVALLLSAAVQAPAEPWVYRGELRDGGAPAKGRYDFELSLHEQAVGGAALLPPRILAGIDVDGGRFEFNIDFADATPDSSWLQLGVRSSASTDAFEPLPQREHLIASTLGGSACWSLDGNAGTDPGQHRLGTTDGAPLQLTSGPILMGSVLGVSPTRDLGLGKTGADNNIEFAMSSPSGQFAQLQLLDADGSLNLNGTFDARLAIAYRTSVGGGGLLPAGVEFAVQGSGGNGDIYLSSSQPVQPEGINLAAASPGGPGLFAPFGITQTNGVDFRPRFGINTFGDVEVATRLFVFGDAFKPGGGSWGNISDARVKREIEPLRSAVDTLLQVEPVSYRYNEDYLAAHPGVVDRRYHGFIAQDFQKVFPESVVPATEKAPGVSGEALLTVDSHAAFVTAVAAVQELAAHQIALEAQIRALRAELRSKTKN